MARTDALGTGIEPRRKHTRSMRFGHFKPAVIQLAFWSLAYFILLSIFAGSSEWQAIDYIYTLVFASTLIIAVAINALILIPAFLHKGMYGVYFISMIADLSALAYFNHILFDKLIDYILPGYYFISYYDFIDLLKFFGAFISITTLIQLAMEWFRLQETRQALVLLEKEKASAELKALTNQVNPHFLFNSLTVLYSLALRESKDAPNVIMQLSDILRYVIYDSSRNMVTLGAEIDLVRNYIGLQRYRVHPSTQIAFNVEVKDQSVQVMSMTFLPLLENSFKHGVGSDTENAFITIYLKCDGDVLEFTICNSKTILAGNSPGIGLKNIETRLNLVYGEDHIFKVEDLGNEFRVYLKLPVR